MEARIVTAKSSMMGARRTIEMLMEHGIIVCVNPDTVRRRITECHRRLGFHYFTILPQFGSLPADLTEKSLRLFAKEVLPAIQSLDDAASQ